jgi:hypothetical protein
LKAVIAIIVLVIGYLGWAFFAEQSAKGRAVAFCERVEIGKPSTGLVELALSAGTDPRYARWFRSNESAERMAVTFIGASPFSRHSCLVTAVSGKIEEKKYAHVE